MLACALVSTALTRLVLAWLRRRAILDLPNERSSHVVPTPRGGGWGIMLTLLPAMVLAALAGGAPPAAFPVLGGCCLLLAVSWADDRRNLTARLRLLTQAAAVAAGLAAMPADALILQGLLPLWGDRLVAGLAWVWFVNLYNFMDGIDGIAGSETAAVGIGVAAVALAAGLEPGPGWIGAAAAGAALGFLVWNWHPAKLFMGDVGSVPLGYVLGWLLLTLAGRGQWVAAVLLPSYFLADATITLLRRLIRGEQVWKAHREHFYQRAVQAGLSHARVVRRVIAADAALVALALAAVASGPAMLLPGAAVVLALLRSLARAGR